MSKSIVSLERQQCPVCGVIHETNAVLFQKRIGEPMLNKYTLTGFGMCPAHQAKSDEGFIALIELSGDQPGPNATLRDTWDKRTGNLAHIKREAFARVFNVPEPKGPICFMQVGVIDALQKLQEAS
jgi:hypothetical protein